MGKTFTNAEAARYIGIKPNTLEIWRGKNKGPFFYRVGRNIVYEQSDLDDFMKSRGVHTLDSINIKK